MEKYILDLNPGRDMVEEELANLDEAKAHVDGALSYSELDVTIYDENKNELCRRRWTNMPVKYIIMEECPEFAEMTEEEQDKFIDEYVRDNDVVPFGKYGHYQAWD